MKEYLLGKSLLAKAIANITKETFDSIGNRKDLSEAEYESLHCFMALLDLSSSGKIEENQLNSNIIYNIKTNQEQISF